MKTAQVIAMPRRHHRAPLLAAAAARRRLAATGGRAWINGREIGGPDPRFAHLSRVHD